MPRAACKGVAAMEKAKNKFKFLPTVPAPGIRGRADMGSYCAMGRQRRNSVKGSPPPPTTAWSFRPPSRGFPLSKSPAASPLQRFQIPHRRGGKGLGKKLARQGVETLQQGAGPQPGLMGTLLNLLERHEVTFVWVKGTRGIWRTNGATRWRSRRQNGRRAAPADNRFVL